jgi:hypothetical protein
VQNPNKNPVFPKEIATFLLFKHVALFFKVSCLKSKKPRAQSASRDQRSPVPKLPYLLNFGVEKITLQSGLLKENH